MATEMIISDSRPTPPLRQVWFNYNQVLSEFGFIFSNPRRVQVWLFPPLLDYILIIFFYYFILYFNINNNNNYNVF